MFLYTHTHCTLSFDVFVFWFTVVNTQNAFWLKLSHFKHDFRCRSKIIFQFNYNLHEARFTRQKSVDTNISSFFDPNYFGVWQKHLWSSYSLKNIKSDYTFRYGLSYFQFCSVLFFLQFLFWNILVRWFHQPEKKNLKFDPYLVFKFVLDSPKTREENVRT